MGIKVGGFTHWQSARSAPKLQMYRRASPNLVAILEHIRRNFAGPPKNNGNYDLRPVRGGSAWSTHAFGAAQDVSFRGIDGWEGVKRDVICFLVEHSSELGVQAVHDYSGPGLTGRSDRGYIWRSTRADPDDPGIGWKRQRASGSGMGQVWADWVHFEIAEDRWHDTISVADRLAGIPPHPPFDPATGAWGLWPLDPHKPLLHVGVDHHAAGDACRYLQGVLNTTGAGLLVDGDFNPRVEQTVFGLQDRHELEVDGRVGPITWGVVDAIAAAPPEVPPTPPPRPTDAPSYDTTVFAPEDGDWGDYPERPRKPVLQIGRITTDDEIDALRYLLGVVSSIGYVPDPDGTFGERTETVIGKVQRSNGLPITGVVDAATWRIVDLFATT